jgi:hypothetical protein
MGTRIVKNWWNVINVILLQSWLSFALFSSVLSFLYICFTGARWYHDDPYMVGGYISLFLLPQVINKEIVSTYSKSKDGKYGYLIAAALVIIYFIVRIVIAIYHNNGYDFFYYIILSILILLLSTPHYLLLKFYSNNKAIVTLISLIGITYIVLYYLSIIQS